jgi:hypothetical protein
MVAHTYYRVIDLDHCGQILANRIPTQAQAQEILALLQKDYPQCELAIEPYHDSPRTQTSAKK